MQDPNRGAADQPHWTAIRSRAEAIGFGPYLKFVDPILDSEGKTAGIDRYELLYAATEIFLLRGSGMWHQHEEPPPAISAAIERIGARFPNIVSRPSMPALAAPPSAPELIWSYWHEEGMLVRAMDEIASRFRDSPHPSPKDPLAHLDLNPLRPLNHLLEGYVRAEPERTTASRRGYEYDHHYGLALSGAAVDRPAATGGRSRFLPAFHTLLHRASVFYKQDDDSTAIADGVSLLQPFHELHLVLSEGAHNQFGDLPWTARVEMLTQEWILARTEISGFLNSRSRDRHAEAWMPQVDAVKKLHHSTDPPVTHFHELGISAERILLSVRHGGPGGVPDAARAASWARYWRPEIQGYIHAFRAATRVDLTVEPVDTTIPAVHLRNYRASRAGGTT